MLETSVKIINKQTSNPFDVYFILLKNIKNKKIDSFFINCLKTHKMKIDFKVFKNKPNLNDFCLFVLLLMK